MVKTPCFHGKGPGLIPIFEKKKKMLNYNKIRFKWSVQLQGLETFVSFISSGLEYSRQESYQGELFDTFPKTPRGSMLPIEGCFSKDRLCQP